MTNVLSSGIEPGQDWDARARPPAYEKNADQRTL
jgi:hypothetical protein